MSKIKASKENKQMTVNNQGKRYSDNKKTL